MNSYTSNNLNETSAISRTWIEDNIEGIVFITPNRSATCGLDDEEHKWYEGFKKEQAGKLGVVFSRMNVTAGLMYMDENVPCTMGYYTTLNREQVLDIHVEALQDLGVDCHRENNDIICQGKKVGAISGEGDYGQDKLMFGVLIALHMDYDTAEDCIDFKHPIRERAAGLNQLGYSLTNIQVFDAIRTKFVLKRTTIDLERVNELVERVYESDAWMINNEFTEANDYTDRV